MQQEGPVLERLTHRLAETPDDFLAEPRLGQSGLVHVGAVVHDLCISFGAAPAAAALQGFQGQGGKEQRNALGVTLLLVWLLCDDWFREARPELSGLLELLAEGARELAGGTPSRKFVSDAERREELVRFALARLGYRPAGETAAQAEDRLTSLSAVERSRVLKAARAAEARARRIREELARKAAEESADKWSRE